MNAQDIAALSEAALPLVVLVFAELRLRNSAATAADTMRLVTDVAHASMAGHGRVVSQLFADAPAIAKDGAAIVADIAPVPVATVTTVTTSAPVAPQSAAVADAQ